MERKLSNSVNLHHSFPINSEIFCFTKSSWLNHQTLRFIRSFLACFSLILRHADGRVRFTYFYLKYSFSCLLFEFLPMINNLHSRTDFQMLFRGIIWKPCIIVNNLHIVIELSLLLITINKTENHYSIYYMTLPWLSLPGLTMLRVSFGRLSFIDVGYKNIVGNCCQSS